MLITFTFISFNAHVKPVQQTVQVTCPRSMIKWQRIQIQGRFQSLWVFFFFFINLFIFIFSCTGSSLLRTGFLQLRWAGATVCCGAQASHCSGFSCCGAPALGTRASAVAARRLSSCGPRALERRLSSCGAQAQLLRGMWDPPRPGLEPMSPALAGGLPTTAPPGKPSLWVFICYLISINHFK